MSVLSTVSSVVLVWPRHSCYHACAIVIVAAELDIDQPDTVEHGQSTLNSRNSSTALYKYPSKSMVSTCHFCAIGSLC